MTRKVNNSYFTYKTMALFEKAGFVEIRHEVSSLEVRTEKNTDLLNGSVNSFGHRQEQKRGNSSQNGPLRNFLAQDPKVILTVDRLDLYPSQRWFSAQLFIPLIRNKTTFF